MLIEGVELIGIGEKLGARVVLLQFRYNGDWMLIGGVDGSG